MKPIARVIVIILFILPDQSLSQGDAAAPFLLIVSSPEANGMGGIAASRMTGNPLAVLANPGQLGTASLDYILSGGFYPSSTDLLPGFRAAGWRYTASAFSAGLNLQRVVPLPVGVGVGFGYSHIGNDLGQFTLSGLVGPGDIGYFYQEEYTDNWSVGVSVDYFAKVGFGYTNKHVVSSLSPEGPGPGRGPGVAKFGTYDLGMLAALPLMKLARQVSGDPLTLPGAIQPQVEIGFGYARRNLGDHFVTYVNPAQADPLPRNAILGLNYRFAFSVDPESSLWDLASFTLAREAEDLLVQRFPAPTDSSGNAIGDPPPPIYVAGSGKLQFFDNVVLGKANGHSTLRKGWEVGLLEVVFIRGGSVEGPEQRYSTTGYGISLRGLLKFLAVAAPAVVSTPTIGFIAVHINVRYDHASSDSDDLSNASNGTTYNSLSLSIR